VIRNNNGNGIECRGEYDVGPVIDGNIIVNNTGNGIDAQFSGLEIIVNNTISGNDGSGIYIDRDTFPDINYNEITNNGKYGIDIQGARSNIYDNNISGNSECGISVQGYEEPPPEDAGKVGPRYYDGKVNLVLNKISENNIGIMSIESEVDVVNCNIVDNIEWAVKNSGEITVDADKNWWGTTDGDEIEAMIEGDVEYVPWLEEPP
jgi:parallel beta-helix repeat protein